MLYLLQEKIFPQPMPKRRILLYPNILATKRMKVNLKYRLLRELEQEMEG